ncbi:MAG: sigma-70 family RNA polymerase sigma factor, partial [Oleibacter sp.]|nr:sigma-70 family RNA polymerase sigma factor [Thalassolituus sp.]
MNIEEQSRLIRAVASGDQAAFEALYQSTGSKLYGVAMHLMRSPERAEEALQDAYVKIWHNAGEYHQGRGSVITWMSSIVRYRCIDLLRSMNAKEGRQDSLDDDIDLIPAVTPEGDEIDSEPLFQCMETLEKEDVQLIHLAYYRGMTHM